MTTLNLTLITSHLYCGYVPGIVRLFKKIASGMKVFAMTGNGRIASGMRALAMTGEEILIEQYLFVFGFYYSIAYGHYLTRFPQYDNIKSLYL